MEAAPQPSETELAGWIRARLERLGPGFADPDAVAETLAMHRDLWFRLYELETSVSRDGGDPR